MGALSESNSPVPPDRRHGNANARPPAPRMYLRPLHWSSTRVTSGPGLSRRYKKPGLPPSSCGSRRGQTRIRTAGGMDVLPGNVGTQPSYRVYSTAVSNAYVERVIGSLRRELLDHVIVLNERHLKRLISSYLDYYHPWRTHRSLDQDAPNGRRVRLTEPGQVVEFPIVHGLHHYYLPKAA